MVFLSVPLYPVEDISEAVFADGGLEGVVELTPELAGLFFGLFVGPGFAEGLLAVFAGERVAHRVPFKNWRSRSRATRRS